MNWINIHTSTLRRPEFIASEPVERATWLCVLSYSAEQENGGRLAGAAHWSDRQWQQMCGVTLKEVRSAERLLRVTGDDVLVAFYPADKEKEVRAKRSSGSEGGRKAAEARRMRSSAPGMNHVTAATQKRAASTPISSPGSSPISSPGSSAGRCAATEGKGIKREGNCAPAGGMPSAGGGETPGAGSEGGGIRPSGAKVKGRAGSSLSEAGGKVSATGDEPADDGGFSEAKGTDAEIVGDGAELSRGGEEGDARGDESQRDSRGESRGKVSHEGGRQEESARGRCEDGGGRQGQGGGAFSDGDEETEDESMDARGGRGGRGQPVDLAEVLSYSRKNEWPDSVATGWFLRREADGWQRASGLPISQWRPDLMRWVNEERHRQPHLFDAPKSPTLAGQAWKSVDPGAFAEWAARHWEVPPPLEGASDRLVERFQEEMAGGAIRAERSTLNVQLSTLKWGRAALNAERRTSNVERRSGEIEGINVEFEFYV